ncbi:MAG: hypothetical protein KGI08_11130 [Thaumarchaeota archaeon]|nr:hypothetical protein [Nitrososphaerota archaeon]
MSRRYFSPGTGAAFTADGTNKGVVTLASTTGFFAGATAWVSDTNNTTPVHVLITEITDSTHLKVRKIWTISANVGDYSTPDLSSFTAAHSSRIDQEPQTVEDPNLSA